MKISIFSTLAVLYAATSVVAAPSATVVDTDSDVDLDYNNLGVTFNEADVFSFVAPQGCSILSCVKVIGQAVCIVAAIETGNVPALLACANRKQLCKCAGCYKALGGFLEEHGVC